MRILEPKSIEIFLTSPWCLITVYFTRTITVLDKMCYGYSLEAPHRGASNEHSQHMFFMENLDIPFLVVCVKCTLIRHHRCASRLSVSFADAYFGAIFAWHHPSLYLQIAVCIIVLFLFILFGQTCLSNLCRPRSNCFEQGLHGLLFSPLVINCSPDSQMGFLWFLKFWNIYNKECCYPVI